MLLLDIESAPHTVFAWSLWDKYTPVDRLIEHGRTLCWAAKWYGERKIYFADERRGTEYMVRKIHELLTEADVVITYNGLKFDIPMLNNEFVKLGLHPIPPQKHIDLLKVARSRFRLASNKLSYLAEYLKLEGKVVHKGFGLWLGCLAGRKEDWAVMKAYNIQDVVLLEEVYTVLRPWIRNHPDVAVSKHSEHCGSCGSDNVQRRGSRLTKYLRIARLHCQLCGSWTDGTKTKITMSTNDTKTDQ